MGARVEAQFGVGSSAFATWHFDFPGGLPTGVRRGLRRSEGGATGGLFITLGESPFEGIKTRRGRKAVDQFDRPFEMGRLLPTTDCPMPIDVRPSNDAASAPGLACPGLRLRA